MMKKRIHILIICLTAILAICSLSLAAEVSVSADSTSVKAGDSVTVTITIKGDSIAAASGSYTYDSGILTYVSGSGAADGTISLASLEKGGASSLTAVVKFTAIAEGEAVINVKIDSALDYEENELGGAEAAVSIKTVGSLPAEEGESPVDYSVTGVPARNVQGTEEAMYIWRDLSSRTLPSRYADHQVEYDGEFVGAARIPDTEKPVLLYLSEADGSNGGYYIYEAAKDLLYPYITVSSVSASYAIIQPDESVTPPTGYTESTLTLSDRDVTCWVNDPESGVYLLYVRNSSDEYGFYLYNQEDSSLQRYIEPPALPMPTPEPTPEPLPVEEGTVNISRRLLYILGGAAALVLLVLLILVIAGAVANARRRKRAAERRAAREARMKQPNSGM